MRGIAALAVAFYHCNERFEIQYFCPHGYLAVDFFFILSGFVLAHAYYGRLSSGNLSVYRFLRLRFIRLMPLIILGLIIGAILELGKSGSAGYASHVVDVAAALILGSLLLPNFSSAFSVDAVFPLNVPVWSLFFEAVANIVFSICASLKLGLFTLVAICLGSAALFAYVFTESGTMNGGSRAQDFLLGFPRIGWSFTIGIILYNLREYAPRISFKIPLLLLIVILFMPIPTKSYDLFDLISAFVLLPMIVFVSSTAQLEGRWQRAAVQSGNISYPLYALHISIMRVGSLLSNYFHPVPSIRIVIVLFVVLISILISILSYKFFDVPIRKWLSSRLKRASA